VQIEVAQNEQGNDHEKYRVDFAFHSSASRVDLYIYTQLQVIIPKKPPPLPGSNAEAPHQDLYGKLPDNMRCHPWPGHISAGIQPKTCKP
jgi:hypothetical protein